MKMLFLLLAALFLIFPLTGHTQKQISSSKITKTVSFPGGTESLKKYLSSHLHYPECSREIGAEGTVIVRAVIDENGHIGQVGLFRSVFPDCYNVANCDSEAIRVVKNMPLWQPALYHGKPVKAVIAIPVAFRLE